MCLSCNFTFLCARVPARPRRLPVALAAAGQHLPFYYSGLFYGCVAHSEIKGFRIGETVSLFDVNGYSDRQQKKTLDFNTFVGRKTMSYLKSHGLTVANEVA